MHPLSSSTRASMISWPTTNWRFSSGFRSSSGIVCHGMYCRATGGAAGLLTARLARGRGFVFDRGFDFNLDLDFDFGISSLWRLPGVLRRSLHNSYIPFGGISENFQCSLVSSALE